MDLEKLRQSGFNQSQVEVSVTVPVFFVATVTNPMSDPKAKIKKLICASAVVYRKKPLC